MYDVNRLLQDAASRTASLASKGCRLEEVWDALNRYITQVMDKRQTIRILNVMCFGWQFLESGPNGASRMRPHFHLTEAFAQSCGAETRAHPIVAERFLAPKEEFNCSKAAIRFSQSLTKDQVFIALRAIFQQLGEVIASGQSVNLDFEIGKLYCVEREVKFVFLADLYLSVGMEVPQEALSDVEYRPLVSFAPPTEDALTLKLEGSAMPLSSAVIPLSSATVKATTLGGWAESEPDQQEPFLQEAYTFAPVGQTLRPQVEVDQLSTLVEEMQAGHGMSEMDHRAFYEARDATNACKDVVYSQAASRRLQEQQVEAAKVDMEREDWERHLQRCVDEEAKEMEWKRAVAADHQNRLIGQMHEAEVRRVQDRKFRLEQGALHAFPDFQHYTEEPTYEYMQDVKDKYSKELVHQIQLKQAMQAEDARRERELDVAHLQANHREAQEIAEITAINKRKVNSGLRESWEVNQQFKQAQSTIDNHHKATNKHALGMTMNALPGNVGVSAPSPRLRPQLTPRQQLTPRTVRQEVPIGSMTPRNTGAGEAQVLTLSPPMSRPVTGSVRRMPLGAAASLALHKKKLADTLRR